MRPAATTNASTINRTSLTGAAVAVAALAYPAAAAADGAIAGTVTIEGSAPEREAVSMDQDPVCAQGEPQLSEAIVAEGDKLKDVYVRVTDGSISGDHSPPSEPVAIDQEDCMYRPRVAGAMPGQTLRIGNSDRTLHNVHGYAGGNTRFNLGQPPKGPDIEREVGGSAGVLELRCDVHPWMRAYIVVSEHPHFDVTGTDGTFAITGVPAGTHTVEAWHPELGRARAEVEVSAGERAEADMSLSAD